MYIRLLLTIQQLQTQMHAPGRQSLGPCLIQKPGFYFFSPHPPRPAFIPPHPRGECTIFLGIWEFLHMNSPHPRPNIYIYIYMYMYIFSIFLTLNSYFFIYNITWSQLPLAPVDFYRAFLRCFCGKALNYKALLRKRALQLLKHQPPLPLFSLSL